MFKTTNTPVLAQISTRISSYFDSNEDVAVSPKNIDPSWIDIISGKLRKEPEYSSPELYTELSVNWLYCRDTCMINFANITDLLSLK